MKKIDQEQIEIMRHSASHVMAMAVKKLFPEAKFGIGPAIENGFYYDFELPRPLKEEDLPEIQREMKRIAKLNLPFVQKMVSRSDAVALFKKNKQKYKLDLIKDIPDKELSLYYTGDDFVDLCRGPHVANTGQIGAFKLDHIAGAYWRGDEKQPMLQRIYAYDFPTEKELNDYIALLEKMKEVDHRKLGKDMDLFSFDDAAPGMAFWHPNGLKIYNKLIQYWREVHKQAGYIEVRTPEILTKETWKQSGHLNSFGDKMYFAKTQDAKELNYALKPMNCDGGIIIYKTKQHSYRDLPIKMGEIGVVHRYEASGEMHGLLRVREFTQDDAHIFCRPDQVKDEIKKVIKLCFDFYKRFGLEIDTIELSTMPENHIGDVKIWEKAEATMKEILKEEGIVHDIHEGEGAFYGPKFDFKVKDSLGRSWQCATIQLDFLQPENFDLEYIDKDGSKVRPVMLHRVIYGSIERFLGVLLEHYAGVLPLWLAPEQMRIIPIADRHERYAKQVEEILSHEGFDVSVDNRSETMQARVRDAEMQKIPYVLVVGDKEQEHKSVAVRPHGQKDTGMVALPEFIKLTKAEVAK